MPATPLILAAQKLTVAGFAPFGDVIEASPESAHMDANGGTAERYGDIATIDVAGHGGRAALSIFRARQPTVLPFRVRQLERHPHGSQAFIPIGGATFLVVVAPPGEAPTAQSLRAFMAGGLQGVNYRPGVWHHPLLALRAGDDFVVVERVGPGDNLEVAPVAGDVVLVA